MLDIRSFLKQSSIYTLSTFLSRAITLLLIPFYTRVLSPQDYGAVDILTVACTLINLTIALEIHQAIARFYNEWKPEDRKTYISTAFIFTILIYGIFSVSMYPLRNILAGYFLDDRTKEDIIKATILMVWTSGLYYFTQSQLRWQLKAKEHAVTSIIFTIATSLVTIFLVLYYDLGVLGVIYGLVAGNAIGLLLAFYFARESYGLIFEYSRMVEMLRFSSPLVLSSVSVFVAMFIDRIMIKDMLTLTDLGLFSIGYKFASVVGLLMVGVNNAITPLIYTHHKDPSTPGQLEKIFKMFSVAALITFVGLSIMASEIITFFTTDAYSGAETVIPFLVVSTLLASLYNFTPGLFIAQKTKVIASINLVTAVINVALNFLLIPVWGIRGACIATLLGYVVGFAIYYFYNQKYYPIKYNGAKLFLASVFSVLTVYCISLVSVSGFLYLIAIKFIVLLLFSITCLAIFAFPRSIRSFLNLGQA